MKLNQIMKLLLNNLLHKYMWVYEIVDGDKGFVIANSREEAINKLRVRYQDIDELLNRDDMYVYDAEHSVIIGDIFVTVPY